MTDITIPAEAVEAAAQLTANNVGWSWEDLSDEECDTYRGIARAAITAALNAWPGMEEHINWPDEELTHIILPLPQKEGE